MPDGAQAEVGLVVQVAGLRRFIPVTSVLEVLREAAVIRVPGGVPAVRGMVNHRGRIITVANAVLALGLPGEAGAGGEVVVVQWQQHRFGVAVDAVVELNSEPRTGLAEIDLEQIAAAIFGLSLTREDLVAYRILICDDAIFMRTMIADILTGAGYEVAGQAESGLQAVERYKTLKPDLVTMDIVMPDMGGIDAVKAIIALDPNARILMCSAMGQQALVVEAIQSGAKDFVVKPFQPARVLEAVQRVLGG